MSLIETASFQLASYNKGNNNASKFAIVLPGRLDTKDYAHIRSHVDFLANNGFYAVAFDPPGTWGSPGDISLYTTSNIIKAVGELIELNGNKPTLLMGHSRGGSTAMFVGTTNPTVTHFVAVMSDAGPTTVDLPKEGKPVMSYRDLPPGTTRTSKKKEFALPAAYFEDQAKYDATEALKQCTKPKLFIYGNQDQLVSEQDVKKIYEASAAPKLIKELGSEHDYRLHPEAIEEVNISILQFLERYKND